MMKRQFKPRLPVMMTLLLTSLSIGNAFAEKPDHHERGQGKPESSYDHGHRGDGRGDDEVSQSRYDDRSSAYLGFSLDQRRLISDYYHSQISQGNCPPGLAKKGNGCQPPGQAKQWQKGQPLGRNVPYYDLPPALLGRLPPAPRNYRYVQVAGDILMIAIGTSMVVDAIEDISR